MEKMVLIEDIHRLLEGISDTKKIKSAWDTYDKFSQTCTFTRMLLKNPISKSILNELHKNRSKDDLLMDHRRVRISEPWYAFYRLYIVNKAWEYISKKDENNNLFVFFDDDDEQIKSESRILEDLKTDDSSSSYVTSDGIGWECIFDYDEFILWSVTLGEFLIPRIKTIKEVTDKNIIIKPFPLNIFNETKEELKFGKYEPIHLSPQEAKIFIILKDNFGNPVSYKTFEDQGLKRKSVTNTIRELKGKILKSHAPIGIESKGKGYFLDNKTSQTE